MLLGLTGGIATGKSTVSEILAEQNIPIVDADLVSKEVVEPGTVGLQRIVDKFGAPILNVDGTLNRKKLGAIVFSDPQKLNELNAIMQPLIKEQTKKLIGQYLKENPLVVLDAPLLFEQGYSKKMDQIMVVAVSPKDQLNRLMKRDGSNGIDSRLRILSQASLDDKIAQANIVIDNSGSVGETKEQVLKWLDENRE